MSKLVWKSKKSNKIIAANHVHRGTDKNWKGYECIQLLVLCGKITLSTSKQSPNIILLRAPRCRGPALHLTITNCSMQVEYFAQRKWRFCLYRPIFVNYNCKRTHTITLKTVPLVSAYKTQVAPFTHLCGCVLQASPTCWQNSPVQPGAHTHCGTQRRQHLILFTVHSPCAVHTHFV